MGGKGEGFTGTIIEDIWTLMGAWKCGREAGRTVVVRKSERKRQKTVLEQQ